MDLPTEAQWEYAARNRGQHVVFPTDNGSLDYGRNFPISGEGQRLTFAVDSLVPNVVVDDQMQLKRLGCFSIDLLEKLQPFLMSVLRFDGADQATLEDSPAQ